MALCCASLALAGFGDAENGNEAINCIAPADVNRYVLRDYEGYVAVFVENEPSCPMTVTDIQVGTLRELDRGLLQLGMKVQSHERLMMMLEDLGS
ncbi:MAG: hypothetical protein RR269_03975 [Oscillospiraceae bacterium]